VSKALPIVKTIVWSLLRLLPHHCRRSDAKREHEHGYGGEAGVPQQLAEGEFQVILCDLRFGIAKRANHQNPNTKLQRNPKLQIPKPAAGSLLWSLEFGNSLVFGAWFLEFSSGLRVPFIIWNLPAESCPQTEFGAAYPARLAIWLKRAHVIESWLLCITCAMGQTKGKMFTTSEE